MSTEYKKPVPGIDELSRPYWEAAKRHELVMQRCRECGCYRYPPGNICPGCASEDTEWVKVSGRGTIFTWNVFHKVYHPAFAQDVPYAIVAVELEEGPRVTSNLVDCRLEDIRIGMPVEVVFEDITEEISLPKFRPVSR
ncbi:MAG TPA: Zn-ribbon domain-containing OB-fold protein [Dehalococcoidia bacterium]|nr:Zn-ribbon domain-containing OB-fold protein [Dehalococcoidia bacterium]